MNRARGIDVSHWQGEVDWGAVRADNVSFAFIKATERDNFVDSRFSANWSGARDAGVLRGAYHFFRPTVNARDQAEHFADTVGDLEEDDLPPILDLETRDGVSNDRIIEAARAWLRAVENFLSRKPIIYTGPFFWNSHMLTAGEPPAWARQHSLWVANYEVSQPILPSGFDTWTFWQFTDKGRVDGIDGNVDLNWFNGSHANLLEYLGIDSLPETRSYQVRPNDSLISIAARFNITLENLLQANPDLIEPDMEIQIPLQIRPAPEHRFHTVKTGENLTLIAQRFGTTVAALVEANNIQNPDAIEVGRVLKIV